MYEKRIADVKAELSRRKLYALLVTKLEYVRYLTGFTGTSGICVVTLNNQYFLTDRRYKDQARIEVKNFKLIVVKENVISFLSDIKILPPGSKIGYDSKSLKVNDFLMLKKLLIGRRLIPADEIMERITLVKEADEIELIKQAAGISIKVFESILNIIKPGIKEIELAAEISYLHKKFGAECDAFEPIVASGYRSALPHARASDKAIRNREMLVIDFGCKFKGYNCDITRTVAIGKPILELKKVYNIVLKAQNIGIERIHQGVKANFVDNIVRKYIRTCGYGKFFIHSLGHSVGLEIHEPLKLSSASKDVLRKGNIVTVEPGIYLPGKGGIRIEDMVLIRERDCEILTPLPKELLIL